MPLSTLLRSIFTPLVIRVLLGVIVAVFTYQRGSLHHKCLLGYGWFEASAPMIVSGVVFLLVMVWRRMVMGLFLGILVGVIFALGVKPWYLQWIHGPNAPASARRLIPPEVNDPNYVAEMIAKYERQRREREVAESNATQAIGPGDRPSSGVRQSAPGESPNSEK